MLVSEPPFVASRLSFDCTPKGLFLSLPVNGKRVSFAENVFYKFRSSKIAEVWSTIRKAAIEAQLGGELSTNSASCWTSSLAFFSAAAMAEYCGLFQGTMSSNAVHS
jgi:hypothetical protein